MNALSRRAVLAGFTAALCAFSFAAASEDPFRFAYRWGSHRVAFELSEFYEKTAEEIWPVVEKLDQQTPAGKLIVLPQSVWDEVKSDVREKIGDTFLMYVPQLAKTVTLKLVTFTPRYCGDGYCGIFGVGETDEALPELPTPREAEIFGVVAFGVILLHPEQKNMGTAWGAEYQRSLTCRGLNARDSMSLPIKAGKETLEISMIKMSALEMKETFGDRIDLVEPGDACRLGVRDAKGTNVAFEKTSYFDPTTDGGAYTVGGIEACYGYKNMRVRVLPDFTGDGNEEILITAGATAAIFSPVAINENGVSRIELRPLHLNSITP